MTVNRGWKLGLYFFLLSFVFLLAPGMAPQAWSQPVFSKSFSPGVIGPGNTTVLTFTLDNTSIPARDLAFEDTLPAGVTIADIPNVTNDCGGSVVANAGDGYIGFSGGRLGADTSCKITVNVTSQADGVYTNTTGDLTSSAGNSGPATANLTVSSDLPGFSKAFSPDAIDAGGRSRLTFTIDNTANSGEIRYTAFTDTLPSGLVIAEPSNLSSTCPGTTTALPGGSVVSFTTDVDIVAAGDSCTIGVDVTGQSAGSLTNMSGNLNTLSQSYSYQTVDCGFAAAALDVTTTTLSILKDFPTDPALPGDETTLSFTIANRDRSASATSITFTDDLDGMLTDLIATNTPLVDPCGPGSSLTGSGFLTLSDGYLDPSSSCTFDVLVQIPAGAGNGSYLNTTSAVTGEMGGRPVTGNVASEYLYIQPAPRLVKAFSSAQKTAGETVDITFTLTNLAADTMTDLSFTDPIFSGASVTDISAGDCPGAIFGLTSISGIPAAAFSGGTLDAGASCTATLTLALDTLLSSGVYTNTTSYVSGAVNGTTYLGPPATDSLTIVGAPVLQKRFADDPVMPGQAVTMEFSIVNRDPANGVSDISFTDDLDAVLSGMVATDLPKADVCGAGSSLTGAGLITLIGGNLAPDETCTFTVSLQTPETASSGTYTNTTSDITASTMGASVTGNPASDDLILAEVALAKLFTDDPALPGGTVNLRFVITNDSSDQAVTDLTFTDDLQSVINGLAPSSTDTVTDVCGVGSTLSWGSGRLQLTGGSLNPGTSCTIDVQLDVPAGVETGGYINRTSGFMGTMGGVTIAFLNAIDELQINSQLLTIGKSFTDDPLPAGDMGTLEFTITNLDADRTATDITFSDNLDNALSGLVALGLPANDICGTGSQINGADNLVLTGGVLGPNESCTFSVNIQVPAGAVGGTTATNTTSGVSGIISGVEVTGLPASDMLFINNVDFSKSFGGPALQDGTVVLTFTIQNNNTAGIIDLLSFSDDLDGVLTGLEAVDTPLEGVCGRGSSLSGTSNLFLNRGVLEPGSTCTFDVTLKVPFSAPVGAYTNTTSELWTGETLLADPASAVLTVNQRYYTISGVLTEAGSGLPIQNATVVFSHDGASISTGTNGEYSYSVPLGATTTLTPSQVGYDTWTPASRTLTNITADQSGQDFTGALAVFTLTVVKDGDGDGTVTGNPPGIDCGSTCSADYNFGTTVDLTATAQPDSLFNGWSGDCNGTGACQVFMDDDRNITASFIRLAESDLAVTKETSTYLPQNGSPITFTLRVTNNGPEAASGVEVTDLLPAGITYLSDDSGGLYNPATGVWTVGNLPEGNTMALMIDGRYDTDGVVTNTVQITRLDGYDPNPNNDSAAVTIDPDADVADLWVWKLGLPKPVSVGDTMAYFVTVANLGPDRAVNVTLTDLLAADITGVQYRVSDNGYGYLDWPAGNTISLGDLNFLQLKTIWIRGEVAAYPADGVLVNTITVSSDTLDVVTGNNSATDETPVRKPIPRCDLSVIKSADKETASRGETVVFTITAANNGPDDAEDVTVHDAIHHGLTYLNDDSGGTYNRWTGRWQVGDLADGASATLNITAQVRSHGRIWNTAAISANGCLDVNPANNSSTVTINDWGFPFWDLALWSELTTSAPSDLGFPAESESFIYEIRYENTGPASVAGVQIQVSLPDGVDLVNATADAGCYDLVSNIWQVDGSPDCADPADQTAGGSETGATLYLTLNATDTAIATKDAGSMEIKAEIIQPASDADITNNSATRTFVRNGEYQTDLALEVTADQTAIRESQTSVIKVIVRNNGPDGASSVQILTHIPPELTLVGANPSQGAYQGEQGIWIVGNLAVNAAATLELTVMPADGAGVAAVRAEISGVAESELDTANDSGQIDITTQSGSGDGGDEGGCFLDEVIER